MLNKKVIIAIVIFIVGGLLIYSFANPLNDSESDLSSGTIPSQSEQNSSKKDKDKDKNSSKDSEDSEKKDSDELDNENGEEQVSGEENPIGTSSNDSSWKPIKFPSITSSNNNKTPLESGTSTGGNNQGTSTGGNNQTPTQPEQPTPENPTPEQPTPENPTPEQPTPENPTPEQPTPEQPVVEPVGIANVMVNVETETATTKTNVSSTQSDKVVTLSGVIEQKVSSVYTYNLEVRLTAPKVLDASILQNFKYNVLENDYGISPKVFSGMSILSNSDRINSEAAYFVVNLPFQEDITAADATPLEISVDWGDGNPIIYSFDFRGISIKKS